MSGSLLWRKPALHLGHVVASRSRLVPSLHLPKSLFGGGGWQGRPQRALSRECHAPAQPPFGPSAACRIKPAWCHPKVSSRAQPPLHHLPGSPGQHERILFLCRPLLPHDDHAGTGQHGKARPGDSLGCYPATGSGSLLLPDVPYYGTRSSICLKKRGPMWKYFQGRNCGENSLHLPICFPSSLLRFLFNVHNLFEGQNCSEVNGAALRVQTSQQSPQGIAFASDWVLLGGICSLGAWKP